MAQIDRGSYLSLVLAGQGGHGVEVAAHGEAAFVQASRSRPDDCCYLNAGTCPDCTGAMVRLGSCFSCPSCGYQSCGG